ncbi:MAG: response regulator transcription factor [Nocardioidaceae bacterium]
MDSSQHIRVGVVDDHDLLVAGVRALLASPESPARFVAGATDVRGLLRGRPVLDVVLLDVRLGDGSSAEDNVRALTAQGLIVLLHADRAHREAVPMLHRTAASGLVWKNDPAPRLVQALVTVAAGGRWEPTGTPPPVELTRRETEVLRLYATGLTYGATAAALSPPVSVESVKTYLSRIRKRYDDAGRPASTRLELRRRALEDGVLPPETFDDPAGGPPAAPRP